MMFALPYNDSLEGKKLSGIALDGQTKSKFMKRPPLYSGINRMSQTSRDTLTCLVLYLWHYTRPLPELQMHIREMVVSGN
jgi:hypothetical protein